MAQWGRLVSCAREFSVLSSVLCSATQYTHGDTEAGYDLKLVSKRSLHLEEHTIQNTAADTSVILRSATIATDCNILLKNQLLRAPFSGHRKHFTYTLVLPPNTMLMLHEKIPLERLAENNTSTFNYSLGTHSSSYLRQRMFIHRVQFTYPIP